MPSDARSMCAESTSFPLTPSLFKDSRKCAIETDSSGVEFVGWIIWLFIGHGCERVKGVDLAITQLVGAARFDSCIAP